MQRDRERDDQRNAHELDLALAQERQGQEARGDEEDDGPPDAQRQSPAEKLARRSNSTGALLCARIHGSSASNPTTWTPPWR